MYAGLFHRIMGPVRPNEVGNPAVLLCVKLAYHFKQRRRCRHEFLFVAVCYECK